MKIIPAYFTGRWPQSPITGDAAQINEDSGIDVCFTCETGDPITHVGFGYRQTVGDPGMLRLSIQGVARDDVIRADGNEIYGFEAPVPSNATAWMMLWFELPAPLTLTAGQDYALAVRSGSGTWDGSNFIRCTGLVATSGTPASLWPAYAIRDGNDSNDFRGPPSFGYRTVSDVYGHPCGGTSGGPVNHYGVAFTPPTPMHLNHVSLPSINQGTHTPPTVEGLLVEDPLGAATVVSTSALTVIDESVTNAESFNALSVYWPDRPKLKQGREYGVILHATAGTLLVSRWQVSGSDGISSRTAYNKGLNLQSVSGTSLSDLSYRPNGLPVMELDVTLLPGRSRPVLSSPHLIGDLR